MAEQITNVIPEKIHLTEIIVIKCNIDAEETYLNNPVEPGGIDLQMGKDIAHDFEEGAARYRLFFDCHAMDSKGKELGLTAEIGIEFHFVIDDFSDFIKEKKGEKHIDIEIGISLMSIAYSTSRGIVLEKTQSTYFQGIILPVIDSVKLLLEEEEK